MAGMGERKPTGYCWYCGQRIPEGEPHRWWYCSKMCGQIVWSYWITLQLAA